VLRLDPPQRAGYVGPTESIACFGLAAPDGPPPPLASTLMRVAAEAILRSRGGRTLSEGSAQVTSQTLGEFEPDARDKTAAVRAFEALGFDVLDAGVTLTISGEPETFERVLGLRLEVRRDAAPGERAVSPTGRLRLPDELDGIVETVVFPERPHLFR
jgi:hypothetical protein